MIWYDMSYNQFFADFLNKFSELEENEAEKEENVNELDQTNTFIFNSDRCFL